MSHTLEILLGGDGRHSLVANVFHHLKHIKYYFSSAWNAQPAFHIEVMVISNTRDSSRETCDALPVTQVFQPSKMHINI